MAKSTIRVGVIDAQLRTKIKTFEIDEYKIIIGDGTVTYTPSCLTEFRVGILFRKWAKGVYWREGTDQAIDLTVKDAFLPILTRKENGKLVTRLVAEAKSKSKQTMKDWQFVVLAGLIAAVLVVSILLLAGVHLTGTTTTIHQVLTSPTPTPIPLG